ncbi:MAG: hypothetical protein KBD01_02655 [Acidobacteria bacterium]|nr:hypothetical protein [Acidobacteriota bacterium]
MRLFLDDAGELAAMPAPRLNIALHRGAIVGWMSAHEVGEVERTNVPCRRSPKRARCPGEIHARFESAGGAIVWGCPVCGDHGYIHGWQGTRWDRRPTAETAASGAQRAADRLP